MSAVPMRKDAAVMEDDDASLALSAFMDGEADMPSFLTGSADARRNWDTYHLIGDILRSEALAQPVSPRFSQGLAQALAAQPAIVAPRLRPLQRFIGRYAIPGAALAVAVIAVTWVAQPYIAPPGGPLQARITPAVSTLLSASLPVSPDLADYVDAHRHMTGMGGVSQAGLDAGQP